MCFLGVPDLSVEDIVDIIECVDLNHDGNIDYREYVDLLKDDQEEEEEEDEVSQEVQHKHISIEPYGADELRTVIARRKRDTIEVAKLDRLRRQTHQEELDVKIFEEELVASKDRVHGPNSELTTSPQGLHTVVYKLGRNDRPLRMNVTSGKGGFAPLFGGELVTTKALSHLKVGGGITLSGELSYTHVL